jgi:hypothetical protein
MEKDIDKIPKNPDTDIVIRIDDFGGRVGLTIREFVKSDRYTGFTKAGTRIPADKFKQFKDAINSIDEKELEEMSAQVEGEKQETLEGDNKENDQNAQKIVEDSSSEEEPEEKAM